MLCIDNLSFLLLTEMAKNFDFVKHIGWTEKRQKEISKLFYFSNTYNKLMILYTENSLRK